MPKRKEPSPASSGCRDLARKRGERERERESARCVLRLKHVFTRSERASDGDGLWM